MLGSLVLLRHGQSTWNAENRFTGWHDVPLTPQGETEAREAGRVMLATGLDFQEAHTSLLRRAVDTCRLALEALGQPGIPVRRSWRLNERHYGALQGLDKQETTRRHGADQTRLWRRSFDVPPPPVGPGDPEHPLADPTYRQLVAEGLDPTLLPASECLRDVLERVLPYWYDSILPSIQLGRNVLVVAHGNSLRALLMHLEGLSPERIAEFNLPTGVPRRYRLVERDGDAFAAEVAYLGDSARIAAATDAVARQAGH